MFRTRGFRIPPAVGAILGIGLTAIGISWNLASLAIAGVVVVAAASVRVLIWR